MALRQVERRGLVVSLHNRPMYVLLLLLYRKVGIDYVRS